MGYFSDEDIQALATNDANAKRQVQERFLALHQKIYAYIQNNDLDLHLIKPSQNAVHHETVSNHTDESTLVVQYLRKRGQAVNVERLMGREGIASANNIITRLHPVIEMRLSETGFAIELLMSPDAWFDQQNVKGKLSISRHRHDFYSTLMKLDEEYCMGFWQGVHLSEMHLSGKYFPHARILDEWMSTFHPNADWFRIGMWYDWDDATLSSQVLVEEIIKHLEDLYPLYQYFLWTSENNFREFNEG